MSDNNMDDLLAQLNAEFQSNRPTRDNSRGNQSHRSTQPPQNPPAKPPIKQMLEQLSQDIQSGKIRPAREKNKPVSSSPQNPVAQNKTRNSGKYRDRLIAAIEQDYQTQARKREAKFAEARRKEAERLAAQKRQQQELIEAQKRAELRERRRKEALKETAQQWLKNLNPRSEEGKWFEEFSYSYEDKLQAAVDYLEAMRESGL